MPSTSCSTTALELPIASIDGKKGSAPWTRMSFDTVIDQSPPTVECTAHGHGDLSLVPTPSALETSTGSFHFFRSTRKSAPKPPRASTSEVNVRLAGAGFFGWRRPRRDVHSGIGIFHERRSLPSLLFDRGVSAGH